MDKGVIEGSKDVGDNKYFFVFSGDGQVSCAFVTAVCKKSSSMSETQISELEAEDDDR